MSGISSWLAVPVPTQDLLQGYTCQWPPQFEGVDGETMSALRVMYAPAHGQHKAFYCIYNIDLIQVRPTNNAYSVPNTGPIT